MVRFLYENSLDDLQDAINAFAFCFADISKAALQSSGIEVNEEARFSHLLDALFVAFKNKDKIFIFEGEATGIVTFALLGDPKSNCVYLPILWIPPVLCDDEAYEVAFEDLLDVASRNLDRPFGIYFRGEEAYTQVFPPKEQLRDIAERKGVIECGVGQSGDGRKFSLFLNSSFREE